MTDPREIAGSTAEREGAMTALLGRLVDVNSFSRNGAGIARVLDAIAGELADTGLAVDLVRERGEPAHLVARTAACARAEARPVLLVGHADTVFPPDDDRKMQVVDGRAHGPGTADMKGGLVIAIEALRALRAAKGSAGREALAAEVIVNGDEEVGSPRSRDLICERARRARACLVFEPAEERDIAVSSRKGIGQAVVLVEGRAAHAGVCPEAGANALEELARKVLEIQALTDAARGVTVTATVARAGTARNTVPDRAEVEVDIRFPRRAEGVALVARLDEIAARCAVAGTRGTAKTWLHRPPMEPGAGTERLLGLARAAAAALGLPPLRGTTTGGGSDANLVADIGVPSLDGLGAVGRFIHTVDEYCLVSSLPERAALAALLIDRIADT
jgi:glutamate carboxypeptidase